MKKISITLLTFLIVTVSFSQNSLEEEIKELRKNAKLLFNEGVRLANEGDLTKAHLKFDDTLQSNPATAGLQLDFDELPSAHSGPELVEGSRVAAEIFNPDSLKQIY